MVKHMPVFVTSDAIGFLIRAALDQIPEACATPKKDKKTLEKLPKLFYNRKFF